MKKGGAQSLVRFPAFYYVCLLWLFIGMQVVSRTRVHLPLIDLIPDQLNAYALVKDFRVPSERCVSSYSGVNPPGITLGFVPGAIKVPTSAAGMFQGRGLSGKPSTQVHRAICRDVVCHRGKFC